MQHRGAYLLLTAISVRKTAIKRKLLFLRNIPRLCYQLLHRPFFAATTERNTHFTILPDWQLQVFATLKIINIGEVLTWLDLSVITCIFQQHLRINRLIPYP